MAIVFLQGLATKAELAEFRGEMRARLSAIEAFLPHAATKADIANLQASMIRWVVGTVISGMAVAVGIAKLLG